MAGLGERFSAEPDQQRPHALALKYTEYTLLRVAGVIRTHHTRQNLYVPVFLLYGGP